MLSTKVLNLQQQTLSELYKYDENLSYSNDSACNKSQILLMHFI